MSKEVSSNPVPKKGASMPKQIITTDKVAKPRVPLSPAVKIGNLLFVSGSTPFTVDYEIARGNFPAQMHQVMENLKTILETAGSSLDKVVKVNVFLARIRDFQEMNEIYRTYFKEGNYPARTTIEATMTNKDFLLEIECVAEV
jgi:2-iminobutanoate/2-iminopropanoate deaminase